VFYYNMMLNLREQNQLSATKIDSIAETLKNFTNQKDELICKKYNINSLILDQWLKAKKNDPKVKEILQRI